MRGGRSIMSPPIVRALSPRPRAESTTTLAVPMLDLRIYRAALLPVALALIIAAFSLTNRPRPIGTTLAPDAFDGARAARTLDALAEEFPDRRPGGVDDAGLASRVAREFRALGPYTVTTTRSTGDTIDGERELATVTATRAGAPGPQLVVVAHRDAAGRGAKAELSGTAALLELAKVVADGRLQRTITFVSTSGGSGGNAGIRAAARRLARPIDAAIVVGDVGSEHVRRPFVVPWSSDSGSAPLRLRRTAEAAVRAETGRDPGGHRAGGQFARLAFPVAPGEQGELNRLGIPAVLLQASGERGPRAGAQTSPSRLQVFGRSALRALTALDNGPDIEHGTFRSLVTQRKVLPLWAIRLLVLALIVPVLLVTVDGFARLRRRRIAVLPWVGWVAAGALPFLLACLFTRMLGATGLISAAPRTPAPPGALPVDGAAIATLGSIALAGALGWMVLRPMISRLAGARGEPDGPGPAGALLLVLCVVALVVWVRNPYAAALLVAPLHLWLAVVAFPRLSRGARVALVVAGLIPAALATAAIARQLGYSAGDLAWTLVLLVAGGGIGPLTWLLWSFVAACAVAAAAIALRPPEEQDAETEVTVRGPLSYAGPGSLGGTESALRR